MKFLKVPKKQAESVRKELIAMGIFSNNYEIIHEGDFILFPVLEKWKFETVEKEGEKRAENQGSLKEALAGVLTLEEQEMLVSSFDILGNIVIIEIPKSLEQKEKRIGDAVISSNRNVKTVLKKTGPMEGEFRVRQVKHIAGENTTLATYKENGVVMKFDVAKVYFSVRLAFERSRISELVKFGEKVLVLFAGVGPFAIVIAKKHPDSEVVAVELNPDAVSYMKGNIKLNKLKNIQAEECDARKFCQVSKEKFDRIIMPLPKSGHEFLGVAFSSVKSGGVVHFYTWSDSEDPFTEPINKTKKFAHESNVEVDFENMRIVRPYAPNIVQVVLDIRVNMLQPKIQLTML